MKLTSAEAAKLLKKHRESLEALEEKESASREFLAALGEDPESVRPAYDYEKTQEEIASLNARIRALRHAINVFNTVTEVPGFGMTIDQLLVYIPQLTEKKNKLARMKARLPKERAQVTSSGVIDYRYANYDVEKAAADFEAVSDELSRAQTALDLVNSTVTFTFE